MYVFSECKWNNLWCLIKAQRAEYRQFVSLQTVGHDVMLSTLREQIAHDSQISTSS